MTNMKPVKIFDWFTRLLPLWVVLCGIIAYFWPFVFIPLKSYLELANALTMLGIGLVINQNEFIPVFRKPHFFGLKFEARAKLPAGINTKQ
ncbi:MAG: hypothetical protein KAJ00_10550 [Deltaproteobacteria bacterium]|nr:hypothetical protein [Deltaproteobacteria bacterium]